jgi:hypothetical protein
VSAAVEVESMSISMSITTGVVCLSNHPEAASKVKVGLWLRLSSLTSSSYAVNCRIWRSNNGSGG